MKQENVVHPGIPLKEDDLEKRRVLSLIYYPKTQYAWATGIAVGRFLSELKAGRIIGTMCKRCGRIVVPPRIFCEWCFRRTDDWIHLPDSGTVNTFSVSYISTDTTRLKTPVIPAVIEIDGTTNAGILHFVSGVEPDDVKIGMRVKAVWKEPAERTGSITDVKYFRPMMR